MVALVFDVHHVFGKGGLVSADASYMPSIDNFIDS